MFSSRSSFGKLVHFHLTRVTKQEPLWRSVHQNIFREKVQASKSSFYFNLRKAKVLSAANHPRNHCSLCCESITSVAPTMSSKAATEALPAAFSRMSTMTPFLYQTKTLSNFTLARADTICRPRYARSIIRRHPQSLVQRHMGIRQYHEEPKRGRGRDRTYDTKGGFVKRQSPPQPKKSRDAEYEIPFEFDQLSKFGHKTEHRPTTSRPETVHVNEFGEAENGEAEDAQGINYEGGNGDILEEEGGSPSMNLRGPRDSTITETEKRAFQRIFSDIFESQSAPPPSTQKVAGSEEMARSKLDAIMGSAVHNLPRGDAEKQKIVDSYPPALQFAAAKALGLTGSPKEDLFDGEMEELAELGLDELEALRDPERERVETLMKNANTDVELWQVMEKEVFSLIPKLGLEDEKPEPVKKETTAKMKKAKKAAKLPKEIERFEKVVAQSPNGTDVTALTLYGPLYPSYLLLGLRLLDRSFAKPSPLALSILPKIKSLGPISHVLGASTQLYNELLRTYFYRYEDFNSIAKTLNEMEKSAVEIDEETLEVIIDILKMKAVVARGEKGSTIKSLWQMPQYARVNFMYWRTKIADILENKHYVGRAARGV